MSGFRRWIGAGCMLVGALQASAAIQPLAAHRNTSAATVGTTSHLTVFAVPQQASTSSVTVTPGKLDNTLTVVAQSYPGIASADHPVQSLHELNPAARFRLSTPTTTPEVLVDVIAKGDPQALKAALANLGMRDIAVYLNDVGGWLPVDQLAQASALAEMHFARAAMPRTRSSIVATQGDFAQQSNTVRTAYPALTGSGVTVGVLSDSFNCFAQYAGSTVPASGFNGYAPFGFTATYANDETPSSGGATSTAALPSGVNVLEEASCLNYGQPYTLPFTDEGRSILQIVHAIAPGAGLAFYTAVNSEADFANGITKLAAAGAKVIDDDVVYPDEPFFQDGLIAQAVDTVASSGVAYFSSAGNDSNLAYENTTPSFSVAGTGSQANEKLLNFDASGATSTTSLPLSIPQLFPGEFIFLVVEWDQPYVTGSAGSGGATSSIDICIQGNTGDLVTVDTNNYPNPVTCTGGSSLGQDPVQLLLIGNPASANAYTAAENVTITIGLVNGGTVPGRVKFALEDDGAGSKITSSLAPGSPTIQGHIGAAGAAAVGAAFYFQTPQCGSTPAILEPYSSVGGDPILFSTSGARLTGAAIQVRNKPDFVAPDGVNNTMLGATINQSIDSNNMTLFDAVNATSITGCQDNENFPSFFGTSAAAPHAAAAAALMLQANPALTPAQIITAMQSTATAMATTAGGAYDYSNGHGFLDINAAFAALPVGAPSISVSPTSVTVGSSATLTWNAVNLTGCTASGSWSGSDAASGTQTVTPTAAGTNTYTLTCTGSGGSVSSSATLTVTAAASSGHHGGTLDLTTLLALSGVLVAGRVVRRRISG
jgi:subtilisin family serine protease